MTNSRPRKISIIGNVATGKTTLSRILSVELNIPVTHVDSLQFLPGMIIRPHRETIQDLLKIQTKQESWIIDGYGPLDILIDRLHKSDTIIFLDLPVYQMYLSCFFRQLKNIFSPRPELPAGCSELSLKHTVKLMKTIYQQHAKMRPELIRILSKDELKSKVKISRKMTSVTTWIFS